MATFSPNNLFIIVCLIAVVLNAQTTSQLNLRPIIGIVTLPSQYSPLYPSSNYSYLASSYVKFIEAGGARVVPIQYDLASSEVSQLFNYLNGFVFTGGDQDLTNSDGSLTQYAQTVSNILTLAINNNNKGTYTPIWGTCQGFQYLASLISKNYSIVQNFSGMSDIASNLTFLSSFDSSRTFQGFPYDLKVALENNPLVYYDASYTVDYSQWTLNKNLQSTFVPLAISTANNQPFVAYIEGTTLPLYGSQFYPEKITFEWDSSENIPHEFDAIRLEQWLGNFFVNETRRNWNQFPNETYALLFVIENFNTTIVPNSSFETIYFFKNVNWTNNLDQIVPPNVNPSLLSFVRAGCYDGNCQ